MKRKNLLVELSIVFFLCSCHGKNVENKQAPTVVQIVQPTESQQKKTIILSGNIEANETVRLGFMVAGKINYIAKQEGQLIRKGELLASLDSQDYQLGVQMTASKLNQMQDDYNRVKELHERKSISESEFIKVQNGLQATQAQADLQQKQLDDTKIYAPINGVLLKRGVEEGEIIGKGLPLFAISDLSKMKVVVSVPENEVHNFQIGSNAKVYVSALNHSYDGEVCEIGALADGTTRSYTMKIEVDNNDRKLQTGMMANAELQINDKTSHLTLPIHCVQKSASNQYYVYVASGGKSFVKVVSIGDIVGNNIEIISGLREADQVISSKFSELGNGMLISIK